MCLVNVIRLILSDFHVTDDQLSKILSQYFQIVPCASWRLRLVVMWSSGNTLGFL